MRFDTRKYLFSSVEVVHHSRQPDLSREKSLDFTFLLQAYQKGLILSVQLTYFMGLLVQSQQWGNSDRHLIPTGLIGTPFVVATRTTLKGYQSLACQVDDSQDQRGNFGTPFVVSSRTTLKGYQPLFCMVDVDPNSCGAVEIQIVYKKFS